MRALGVRPTSGRNVHRNARIPRDTFATVPRPFQKSRSVQVGISWTSISWPAHEDNWRKHPERVRGLRNAPVDGHTGARSRRPAERSRR